MQKPRALGIQHICYQLQFDIEAIDTTNFSEQWNAGNPYEVKQSHIARISTAMFKYLIKERSTKESQCGETRRMGGNRSMYILTEYEPQVVYNNSNQLKSRSKLYLYQ